MQSTPFFSVVIPVYNQPLLVQTAIESVLNQNFGDYEILVIDDGSDDDTPAVLSKYSKSITVFRQNRSGPGAARNKAIACAKGKYVTFLDSDDLWFPWTLDTFNNAIHKHGSPSIVSGTHVDILADSDIENCEYKTVQEHLYKDYLATASDAIWLGTCATAIRKDILRGDNSFLSGDINGEDSDLWLLLGTAHGFVYIKEPPLFAYRRRINSRISDIRRTVAGIRTLVDRENKGDYPGGRERQLERWTILTRHVRPVVIACIRNGMPGDAWQLYKKTFKWQAFLYRFRFILVVPFMLILSAFKR